MNRQGKVGEQVVRQPPTNENCLIKKGMLRVHHSYKLSFVRQRGLWDILKVRRSLCKKIPNNWRFVLMRTNAL